MISISDNCFAFVASLRFLDAAKNHKFFCRMCPEKNMKIRNVKAISYHAKDIQELVKQLNQQRGEDESQKQQSEWKQLQQEEQRNDENQYYHDEEDERQQYEEQQHHDFDESQFGVNSEYQLKQEHHYHSQSQFQSQDNYDHSNDKSRHQPPVTLTDDEIHTARTLSERLEHCQSMRVDRTFQPELRDWMLLHLTPQHLQSIQVQHPQLARKLEQQYKQAQTEANFAKQLQQQAIQEQIDESSNWDKSNQNRDNDSMQQRPQFESKPKPDSQSQSQLQQSMQIMNSKSTDNYCALSMHTSIHQTIENSHFMNEFVCAPKSELTASKLDSNSWDDAINDIADDFA
jgi:chemotaxis protein histidine kinase CheA